MLPSVKTLSKIGHLTSVVNQKVIENYKKMAKHRDAQAKHNQDTIVNSEA